MKQKGHSEVSFSTLNKLLSNVGSRQFNYDVFKAAYDQDLKLQKLITNFDQDKIEFKTSEVDDVNIKGRPGRKGDIVGKMAKNAVDLTDL